MSSVSQDNCHRLVVKNQKEATTLNLTLRYEPCLHSSHIFEARATKQKEKDFYTTNKSNKFTAGKIDLRS